MTPDTNTVIADALGQMTLEFCKSPADRQGAAGFGQPARLGPILSRLPHAELQPA
jgi:hypothetical protein